jgi:hypothetical protein
MRRALVAGNVYFLAVFAVGFALGTARVLLIAPRLGELVAVAIELPFMLTMAWFICLTLIRRFSLTRLGERMLMGGMAFVLLICVEFALSIWAFDRTPVQYFSFYQTSAGLLGLAGQCLFALLPFVQWILVGHALSSPAKEGSHASRSTTQ